jgi:hypothetical protein
VQLLGRAKGLGIGLQSVGCLEVARETICPESVAAADIEQCPAIGFIDTLTEQGKFAISIKRTIAADCGVQAIQYTHLILASC